MTSTYPTWISQRPYEVCKSSRAKKPRAEPCNADPCGSIDVRMRCTTKSPKAMEDMNGSYSASSVNVPGCPAKPLRGTTRNVVGCAAGRDKGPLPIVRGALGVPGPMAEHHALGSRPSTSNCLKPDTLSSDSVDSLRHSYSWLPDALTRFRGSSSKERTTLEEAPQQDLPLFKRSKTNPFPLTLAS
ncbi:hypothetical protein BHE74_00029576 [Ensete ventricosum]|nr:hypothetical protein BHE74_00029576 [Ensete ventricosum]